MNRDFIQDSVEIEDTPRLLGILTGWEAVIFEVEDEPPPEGPSS